MYKVMYVLEKYIPTFTGTLSEILNEGWKIERVDQLGQTLVYILTKSLNTPSESEDSPGTEGYKSPAEYLNR